MTAGVCRGCGCTNERACTLFAGSTGPRRLTEQEIIESQISDVELQAYTFPCCWIEPDLCSACLTGPAPAPLLYGADGEPLQLLRGAP
jgi:hypothetical protein